MFLFGDILKKTISNKPFLYYQRIMTDSKLSLGGEFLIKNTTPKDIFIPEEWSDEQLMIAQTCEDFIEKEVLPEVEALDEMKDLTLMPSLLDKAGELGLLGTSVPEEYGGFGADFNTSMLVGEKVGAGYSFAVALSANTGIGTLPILYYGNAAQKQKYLPKLATGEYKASYCLTEPDAGSDPNSGKTKAVLSSDGKHFHINGQKIWITNAGFADILIVFAKIEEDKNLSAFIVERETEGITFGPEEKKLGIKGSSTRQIFFNDVIVPVENQLSERENGFKIALNILNIGRIKLASATVGAGKACITHALVYANERKQFDKAIASFGAIQHKIAEMVTKTYASESAAYRVGQYIDDKYNQLVSEGVNPEQAKLKATEEFAIECAIMKVHASEALDYVVDEGVQIYGGMGYSADAPMERAYRDSRINRIFEGTNEINRMLTIDMLMKKVMKGELDLMSPIAEITKELTAMPSFGDDKSDVFLNEEAKVLSNMKKIGLLLAGASTQKLMMKLKEEQEILMNLADILIEIFVSESLLLRVQKLEQKPDVQDLDIRVDMLRVYLHDANRKINTASLEVIYAFAEGDELKMLLLGLKRFSKISHFNLKEARRRIAAHSLNLNAYPF